ncbi:YeiH family protein [Psychrobacter raelei]|uniref:YeiH family protein n=1 Tax=Psychrobacter raelei TaxID=2565531 RepID=A0AAT9PH73_9GAMM|nr:YeiH family protein [Psychrobacter sp. PraFG1]UNK06277.1 YeiH family protein [Psychrobacter sp. PraFG1]
MRAHPTTPIKIHPTQYSRDNKGLYRLSVSALLNKLNQMLGGYLPNRKNILGLLMVLSGSLISIWLNERIQDWTEHSVLGLSALTLAILIGMVLGNTLYPRFANSLTEGVTFCKAQILRLAIVLYGFKITLAQVVSVGGGAIATDALVLSSTFMMTYLLGTKVLKMDRTTTMLIGSGASICGAAAVIAAEPVLKAESHKVTIAVATVVVFGTLSMLLYPLLYQMGWLAGIIDPQHYGVYIGSTIHEVAQVVVAGNAISPEVGNTAVVTKMIRVMMLAPFLLLLSVFVTSVDTAAQSTAISSTHQPSKIQLILQRFKSIQVPWFAFVFLAMVGINSLLSLLPGSAAPVVQSATQAMIHLDNLLLTMAMFALGLTTHFSAIKKAGIKPLVLAAVMFIWLILGGAAINIVMTQIS